MRLLKKIFSIFILIIALSGIIYVTVYTLNNKGIREEVKTKEKQTIEKISTNQNDTTLSEIYHIYLNREKHKIKIDYQFVKKEEDNMAVVLYIYFDGKSVLEREVVSNPEVTNMSELFKIEDVSRLIRIQNNNFHIIKENEVEYLLVDVGSLLEVQQIHYYVFDNNGDILQDKGILAYDSSKNYVLSDDEVFPYYGENGEHYIAKLQGNDIYSLEEKTVRKKINVLEYRYYLENGEFKKEHVRTIEKVKKVETLQNDKKEEKEE